MLKDGVNDTEDTYGEADPKMRQSPTMANVMDDHNRLMHVGTVPSNLRESGIISELPDDISGQHSGNRS